MDNSGVTSHRPGLADGPIYLDAIMQLESGFQAIGLRRIISSFRTMFTVSIMLSALMLLMIEIRNLSAITSGVEQKVPTDDIISNLVRPE